MTISPAVSLLSRLCAGVALGAATLGAAPLPAGIAPDFNLAPVSAPVTLDVQFTVDVAGVKNIFPAVLHLKKGAVTGTIDAFGATATVDRGSTDKRGNLNLQATIPNETTFSLVGTLKFKTGTGSGIFTDGSVTGTYTAKKG